MYVAALALHALWLHRYIFDVGGMLDQAQAFLLAQQTGSAWRAPFETALAVLAILPRLNATALMADSVTALQAAQAADGSWANDVYTTALALRALALADTPVPNPDLGTLQGRVIDGDSGIALSGVTAALTGATTLTRVTDTTGTFVFPGLVPGLYMLTLRLAEYGTVTTMTAVPSGGQVDLGDVRLLKTLTHPTTGTVRGVVTSAVSGAPLAGVTVTVNGQTTFTSSDGTYQCSPVLPGPVTVTASLTGYLSAFGSGPLLAGSPARDAGRVPRQCHGPVPGAARRHRPGAGAAAAGGGRHPVATWWSQPLTARTPALTPTPWPSVGPSG